MLYRRNKKKSFNVLLLLLVISLGIGYALISTNLTINGVGIFNNQSWNIHFEDLTLNPGNVALSTGDVAASINQTTKTDITFTVTLQEPGDFYEFEVAAVNSGTIDAMIGLITNNLNNNPISSTNPVPAYAKYTATYSDGVEIAPNHLLEAGYSETYKVRVEYRTDINPEDLPDGVEELTFSFGVEYVQKDSNAIERPLPIPDPASFADDSWETVVAAIKSGNTSNYHVGDTKTVDLGTLGVHTLRIANTSNPSECSTVGFSETACGFVLEFADIITRYNMNSTDTNVGGWPASAMRTYVNETIYNALPSALRSGIINTTVVSGHGSTSGETNFTSTDKIYLLSTHEVWEDVDGNTSSHNTEYNNTRQLDYYRGLNVTTPNYSGATKKRNGSNSYWWLRSTYSSTSSNFFGVTNIGDWSSYGANTEYGVSPAFRIG